MGCSSGSANRQDDNLSGSGGSALPEGGAVGAGQGGVNSSGGSGPGGSAGAQSAGAGGSTTGGTSSGGSGPGGSVQGGSANGGSANGGTTSGGTSQGGSAPGGTASGGASSGGSANGGTSSGGTEQGGSTSGGSGNGGTSSGGGTGDDWYPCNQDTSGYDVVVTGSGNSWTVQRGNDSQSASGLENALTTAYGMLTSGRTSKESILVQGDGSIDASSQVRMSSYTVLNVCGTIDVTGTASGSDKSPIYARGASNIDIPHLTMTGSPQYAIFFRETSDIHLGHITLDLSTSAGRGLRVDNSSSSGIGLTKYDNLTVDYIFVRGSGGHGMETYGINNITVGQFVGERMGGCGLIFNDSTNAEVGSVDCTDCAYIDTGYAAFRIANQAGRIDGDYPAGNIHVGEVNATGGGRGIFCVSTSGGLTVDRFDIDAVGGDPDIFIENCYNVTMATDAGTLNTGRAYIGNNADNGPPASNVTFENITLTGGAYIEENCDAGDGNQAINITGGSVNMCN